MIEPQIVEYWDDEPSNGIKVDWDLIRKKFRKIAPKKYHDLISYPFEKYSYNLWMSERTGYKTTQVLLIGLIAYQMYGTQLEYIREAEEYTTPKKLDTLYNSIIGNGYLQKIFGEDSWTDIQYRGGFFRLIRRGDDGKPEMIQSDYIAHVIANDQPDDYKSSYSTIRGDLIFYDEFVGIRPKPNSHHYFRQNLSTILRKRQHGVIFMAANNINFNNDFYADFRIRRDLQRMDPKGDIKIIDKDGTIFYVRIIPPDRSAAKQAFNKKYFGYAGKSAAAITGGSWEMREFPHISPSWARSKPLIRNYYIEHLGDLLRLTICRPPEIGTICLVTPATRIYDDSRIFTVGDITDRRYIYKCGSSSAGYAIFWALYKRNRWYYANNECGELVAAFIAAASRAT